MSSNRTKYGIVLGVGVLAGFLFPLIALLLLVTAGLMIASGKEPQKTEQFLNGFPGGNYVIKALTQIDDMIS